MRSPVNGTVRIGAAVVIFAAGVFVGSISQRPAAAQLGELGGKAMEKAGGGGAVSAVTDLGTQITDMQKNVEGLQKNLEMFKKIQSLLGG